MQIDWLEGTVHGMASIILDQLRQYFKDWQETDRGGLGYEASATVWDSGRVLWSQNRPQMGVHIWLPSTALAVSEQEPLQVLCDLKKLDAKMTRIDLAADDTIGMLDLDEIARKSNDKCEMVCLAHSGDQHRMTFGDSAQGHTEYYGSRRSETYVRIYDKAAEQRVKRKVIIPHWVRVEYEYKGQRAEMVANYIVEHPNDWREAARGWFLSYLDFKEPSDDPNKSRWTTCEWWLKFLDYASKVRLFRCRSVKTIDDVVNWVEHQVTPSLFVLSMTIGHDDLFRRIGNASERLSPKHLELIESYEQQRGDIEPT